MLVKESVFEGVNSFAIKGTDIMGVVDKTVHNLTTNTLIKRFENPVGEIIKTDNLLFLADWYVNTFVFNGIEIIPNNHAVVIGRNNLYIESLSDGKGSILRQESGEILWETNEIIPSYSLISKRGIFFIKIIPVKRRSLVFIDMKSGKTSWELFLDDLPNEDIASLEFGKILGLCKGFLFVALRTVPQIIKVDITSGKVSKVTNKYVEKLLTFEADIETIQIDCVQNRFVHPYLEYNFFDEKIIDRLSRIKEKKQLCP